MYGVSMDTAINRRVLSAIDAKIEDTKLER